MLNKPPLHWATDVPGSLARSNCKVTNSFVTGQLHYVKISLSNANVYFLALYTQIAPHFPMLEINEIVSLYLTNKVHSLYSSKILDI